MANFIFEPKSGDDLLLQNNGASRKIKITNAGQIEVTGDLNVKDVGGTNRINITNDGSTVLYDEGGDDALQIDTSGNTTLLGSANNIGTVTSGTFNGTIGSSATLAEGMVIQQKSTIYTDTTSFTGTSAISQIAVTITGLTSGSDVLIFVSLSAAASSGSRYGFYVAKSGTTALTGNIADSASNRPRMSIAGTGPGGNGLASHSFVNLDESVSAGSSTYTVVGFAEAGLTCKINRSNDDSDSASVPRGVSSITVMEIAQ
tara:strand:+ start:2934 stop:3710 length:777 start_codon:yes stop_codon:yes gene_type:complete